MVCREEFISGYQSKVILLLLAFKLINQLPYINFLTLECRFFQKDTYDFQNFGHETLFIANYENIKKFKSSFDWSAAKIWLKESTILWNVSTFERMNFN